MTFLYKVFVTFFLKPLRSIDIFLILNGNYRSYLEARVRELNLLAFLAPFWGQRGQKMIFINRGIYYHVIPQNVLLLFHNSNEWVCFSEFSIFGLFYVHFWSKLTPKFIFSQNTAPILLVGTLCDLKLQFVLLRILASIYEFCVKNAHFCAQNWTYTPSI